MLCNKCKVNQACYHSTLIVNGESKSKHLCKDCAIKEGLFKEMESSIFDNFALPIFGFDRDEMKECPNCHWTLRQLERFGKVGCVKCYDAFEEEIADILKRTQPYVEHKADKIEFKVEENKKALTKAEKLTKLKADLQKAIEEERYEDAGMINKQVKKLTKELEGE